MNKKHIPFAYIAVNIPEYFQNPAAAAQVNFGDYIRAAFTWSLVILSIIAVIMLIVAGFQLMTSEIIGKKIDAKGRIKEILLGLLVAFSSYLVLNTINPQLTTIPFFKSAATPQGTGVNNAGAGNGGAGAGGNPTNPSTGTPDNGDPDDPTVPEDNPTLTYDTKNSAANAPYTYSTSNKLVGTEAEIRNMLSQKGITINKAAPATSVAGLRESTLRGIDSVKGYAGVNGFVITGGTESGHKTGVTYSHENGYKFDIGANSNGSNYSTIKSALENAAKAQNSNATVGKDAFYGVYDSKNSVYLYIYDEGDHLDVQVIPTQPK